MNKIKRRIRWVLPAILLLVSFTNKANAQEQKWMVIGQTQAYFYDYGAEEETESGFNFLTWPTQYGTDQHTMRYKGLWLGAKNFYDPIEGGEKSVKVIGSGPRLPDNHYTMLFPQSIKMIGKFDHPTVSVDNAIASSNFLYDVVDELDPELAGDRVIEIEFNTSIGVTVKKKVIAFAQQNHDDYFIYDYVFTNTGKYNEDSDVHAQDLEDFWIYHCWRPAFAGVTSAEYGSTWGSFASQWGTSTMLHTFNINSSEGMRGFYSWYGPTNSYNHPLEPAEDWGCPDHEDTGVLGSAKYMGAVTLFASQSPDNYEVDNEGQPATDAYVGADGTPVEASVSQYDEVFMQQRYNIMSEGHLENSQDVDCFAMIGTDGYVEDWTDSNPYRDSNTGGSALQGWGFGPYQFKHGDSLHIVFAEGVSGISWEKCREVGKNWIAYYKGTSQPELVYPAGRTNEWGFDDHNGYKRAWCETGADSVMKMLNTAVDNYGVDYNIPKPPPPPEEFTVTSGGDKITLTWAENAISDTHFDGYVIYRSEGEVKQYTTVYQKIFECSGGADLVHVFDDTSAVRGFNYYYYIQSKDDGTQNDVDDGVPLYSSMFWTLTSVPAYLRRQAGSFLKHVRVVPNPYDIRARMFQFGEDYQYDRIAFYELPPVCKLKIFTERGDLIWSKEHTDGSGDELWDSMTSSRQIIVSGIYILYVEVTEDIVAESDIIAPRDYVNPKTNEVEISQGEIVFSAGELIFKKGDSIIRKFAVIR